MVSESITYCVVLFAYFGNTQGVMLVLNALLGSCSSMIKDSNRSADATANNSSNSIG